VSSEVVRASPATVSLEARAMRILRVLAVIAVMVLPATADWVTATVATGDEPIAAAVNPVTNRIYVTNRNEGTVTVIDGSTNGTTTVEVDFAPCAVAVNPVTNKIYVGDYGGVTVIDGATNDATPVGPMFSSVGVAANPVTNKIYAVGDDEFVTVIDGTGDTVVATVGAGPLPRAVAVNTVTNRVYVTGGLEPGYRLETFPVWWQ
jgi:YVTN family beta-propeller protein